MHHLVLEPLDEFVGSHLHRRLEQELDDSHDALGEPTFGVSRVAHLEAALKAFFNVAQVKGGFAHVELQQERVGEVDESRSGLLLKGKVAEQAVEHCAHHKVPGLFVVRVQFVGECEAVVKGHLVVVAGGVDSLKGGC